MAYINGKEVLFSAQITNGESGNGEDTWVGKIADYEQTLIVPTVSVTATKNDLADFMIEKGDTVKIVYNGVEHEHKLAVYEFSGDQGGLYAGNLALLRSSASDTGEPYAFFYSHAEKVYCIYNKKSVSNPADIAVYWMKPIPENYLPESFLRKQYVTVDMEPQAHRHAPSDLTSGRIPTWAVASSGTDSLIRLRNISLCKQLPSASTFENGEFCVVYGESNRGLYMCVDGELVLIAS